jgi:hypothetical protein
VGGGRWSHVLKLRRKREVSKSRKEGESYEEKRQNSVGLDP